LVKWVVLSNVTEAKLLAANDFALVEILFAQQDATERRFAGAVAADEADLLVVGQRAARPVEQLLVPVALVGVEKLKDDGHGVNDE
jgi:hypothetical protein